ncbi:MAG: DUF4143 domain-containing protein [Paracoccaceae bacterium]|nr:DUF4143 domain-containing protein [Paracoccaceae bacterium]MDE2915571.1 DUF4143 domain-containing protein [Paracoccaceae bacterium]
MFPVRQARAWHRSGLKRLVNAPKLAYLDSGLLAALQQVGPADVAGDRQKLGPHLECFVLAELANADALSDETTTIRHYGDEDQIKVDLVLSDRPPMSSGSSSRRMRRCVLETSGG